MSDQATNALRFMAGGKELKLVPDVSDADAEGQKLRYVEQLDGVDLGATMLDLGLAVAEPDEPDIARGGQYAQRMVDAQAAAAGMWAPDACPPATTTPTPVHYNNCDEVRAANAAPLHADQPGYSSELDADNDGIACDVES
jgi:endonuclease YncB( thermonuclease family)